MDDIVYSHQVLEFVTVANEYCSFVEKTAHFTKKDYVTKFQKLLPLLYLKASLIPDIESDEELMTEKIVSEADMAAHLT